MNEAAHLTHGRILASDFRPAPGLAGPHRQTLAGAVWPVLKRPRIHRERWELPDGDFTDIDWVSTSTDNASWALVLPGILGNIRSPYVGHLLGRLSRAGYRAGMLNHRGLSGIPNRLAPAYHAGFTRDLDLVARRLADNDGPGIVIGFSMGGSVVLKWLGENATNTPVTAAAAVSVPFQLAPAADSLHTGGAGFYGGYLLRGLRRQTERKFSKIAAPFPLPPSEDIRTLRDFDDRITAPLHGFASADDYYTRSSSLPWLRRIEIPTLIVNAADDPLVPRDSLPGPADISPSVKLELTDRGGHVGFLGRGRYGRPRFWLDDRLLEFLHGA
ncbi:MAG: alpha/beta fold hydrolase [Gammaproteobacteria bacterium]